MINPRVKSRLRWALFVLIALLLVVREVWAFSGFQRSLNDTRWGLTAVSAPVRAGRVAERFELRQGDCAEQPGWSDCANDRERVEQSQLRPYIQLGEEVWVSWSIMLDPSWRDISPVTTTLGQFHHRDSSTPALLFVQRYGRYALRIESAKSLYPGRDHYTLMPLEAMLGRWTDIVVQARFSSGADGVLRVWVNGEQRVDILGPNTLGTKPIFFKYGIYRSFVSRVPQRATGVVYWDEVRSGPTRAEVDPRVNPRLGARN